MLLDVRRRVRVAVTLSTLGVLVVAPVWGSPDADRSPTLQGLPAEVLSVAPPTPGMLNPSLRSWPPGVAPLPHPNDPGLTAEQRAFLRNIPPCAPGEVTRPSIVPHVNGCAAQGQVVVQGRPGDPYFDSFPADAPPNEPRIHGYPPPEYFAPTGPMRLIDQGR